MEARDGRVVLVTAPDEGTARSIARTLVDERLAACGNILSAMTSIYRWQDAIEEASEALLILKTSGERVAALSARITELHPYDVPEVLALTITAGHQPYLEWLGDCLRERGGEIHGT